MVSSREHDSKETDIRVIGIGGAGNNMVHRINGLDLKNIKSMALNTDMVHIEIIDCPTKILIGEDLTHGLGAAGCPEIGEECAKKAYKELSRIIGNPDLLFIVAGLGGGTGTGASVVVARMARETGAFVVAVVSMPFSFEGQRKKVAEGGLEKLRENANCVIVIDNDRLMEIGGHLPVEEAFSIIDHLISGLIENLSKNITLPNKITEEVPVETAPISLVPPVTITEGEEEKKEHVHAAMLVPPPLVTVDMEGMEDLVETEEPRSIQGLKMAKKVFKDLQVPIELPKKSNVLISETRPLTLLPFLLHMEDNVLTTDYLKEFMKKNKFGPTRQRTAKGGIIVKMRKELDENEPGLTTKPMTQTRLDNIWV